MPYPKGSTLKPTMLDEKAQAFIVQAMAEGNYLVTALNAAGVSEDTYYRWKKLYDEGSPAADRYADFFESIKKATAIAEMNAVRTMRKGEIGWQGEATYLERRFKKRWAPPGKVIIVPKGAEKPDASEDVKGQVKQEMSGWWTQIHTGDDPSNTGNAPPT